MFLYCLIFLVPCELSTIVSGPIVTVKNGIIFVLKFNTLCCSHQQLGNILPHSMKLPMILWTGNVCPQCNIAHGTSTPTRWPHVHIASVLNRKPSCRVTDGVGGGRPSIKTGNNHHSKLVNTFFLCLAECTKCEMKITNCRAIF